MNEIQEYNHDEHHIIKTNYAKERAIELKKEVDEEKSHSARVGRKIGNLIDEIESEEEKFE